MTTYRRARLLPLGSESLDMSEIAPDLRERILAEIRRLNQNLGKPPGRAVFFRESGFTDNDILRFWPSFTVAVSEAGLTPNRFNSPLPEDTLLRVLADAVRELGAFPTFRAFRHYLLSHPGTPSHTTYDGRYRTQAMMFDRLQAWIADREDYSDVRELLLSTVPKAPRAPFIAKVRDSTTSVTLSDSYVPPVIASLAALAVGDPEMVAAVKALGKSEETEFERRVGIAFGMMGLEVKQLGQGTGRKADGIAKSVRGHWAIIYDAKLRRAGFRLETEDRKFREYIERHGSELRNEGIERFYFAVVSSSFRESDLDSARAVVRATNAKAFVFIQASSLVHWVEQHLKQVAGYSTDELEARLDRTGIAI